MNQIRENIRFSTLKPEETLVAIIDMNKGFAKAGSLYSDRVEAMIPDIAKFAKQALEVGMPVLAYTDYHPEDALEFKAYPSHCVGSSEESDLVDELKELEGMGLKTIKKNSTNGILAYNPVNDYSHIKNYVVVGCVTDICIYQYAVTLRTYLNEHQLPGEVIVIEKMVETFDIPEIHEAEVMNRIFLKSLESNGVLVMYDVIL